MSEVIETPQPVVFTTEQQLKVDAIIRNAMGRASLELREKNAQLEAELTETKSKLVTPGEETETLRRVATAKEKENLALREENIKTRRESLVNKYADRFVDVGAVLAMSERNLQWSEQRRGFEIVNEDGSPRINYETGVQMTPSEFFDAFAKEKPYFVRTDSKVGDFSRSQSNGSDVRVEQIFGKKSDSRLANQLAMTNKPEYDRLRVIAKKTRLI